MRHLENRHDVIFSAEGGLIWIISQTGAEWHVDCGDMVEIETRCRIPMRRTFGQIYGMSSQSHLPHCRVLPPGELNVMIPELCVIAGCCHWANSMACHLRATYHIEGCCHLVNSLSWFQSHMPHCRVQSPGEISVMNDRATLQGVIIPSAILKIVFSHILFFLFLMQFGLWRAAAFDTLVFHNNHISVTAASLVILHQSSLISVQLPVWLNGNMLVSINVVTLRRVRLVPEWVTIIGWVNHLGAEPGTQVYWA